ncbi:hypothetical protein C8Q79DRAFT_925358 [Trametes meyenii]|nr:hypothetical protein C8Q79DRAFT_925358 [Trametes meyenii]
MGQALDRGHTEDSYDAMFVWYEVLVNQNARYAHQDPVFQAKTLYGQLQHIFMVQLAPIPSYALPSPPPIVFAVIHTCEIQCPNEALNIHYYAKMGGVDYVDITTVQHYKSLCALSSRSACSEQCISACSLDMEALCSESQDVRVSVNIPDNIQLLINIGGRPVVSSEVSHGNGAPPRDVNQLLSIPLSQETANSPHCSTTKVDLPASSSLHDPEEQCDHAAPTYLEPLSYTSSALQELQSGRSQARSVSPVSPDIVPTGKPPPGHATHASSSHNASGEDDSGSDTEEEVDPIYNAYMLGYWDSHRDGYQAFRQEALKRLEKVAPNLEAEDGWGSPDGDGGNTPGLTSLVQDVEQWSPPPRCTLTPRMLKQIHKVLLPSPEVRKAVRNIFGSRAFQIGHAAYINVATIVHFKLRIACTCGRACHSLREQALVAPGTGVRLSYIAFHNFPVTITDEAIYSSLYIAKFITFHMYTHQAHEYQDLIELDELLQSDVEGEDNAWQTDMQGLLSLSGPSKSFSLDTKDRTRQDSATLAAHSTPWRSSWTQNAQHQWVLDNDEDDKHNLVRKDHCLAYAYIATASNGCYFAVVGEGDSMEQFWSLGASRLENLWPAMRVHAHERNEEEGEEVALRATQKMALKHSVMRSSSALDINGGISVTEARMWRDSSDRGMKREACNGWTADSWAANRHVVEIAARQWVAPTTGSHAGQSHAISPLGLATDHALVASFAIATHCGLTPYDCKDPTATAISPSPTESRSPRDHGTLTLTRSDPFPFCINGLVLLGPSTLTFPAVAGGFDASTTRAAMGEGLLRGDINMKHFHGGRRPKPLAQKHHHGYLDATPLGEILRVRSPPTQAPSPLLVLYNIAMQLSQLKRLQHGQAYPLNKIVPLWQALSSAMVTELRRKTSDYTGRGCSDGGQCRKENKKVLCWWDFERTMTKVGFKIRPKASGGSGMIFERAGMVGTTTFVCDKVRVHLSENAGTCQDLLCQPHAAMNGKFSRKKKSQITRTLQNVCGWDKNSFVASEGKKVVHGGEVVVRARDWFQGWKREQRRLFAVVSAAQDGELVWPGHRWLGVHTRLSHIAGTISTHSER